MLKGCYKIISSEEPKDKIMRFYNLVCGDFYFIDTIFSYVLERKNDDGSIHFYIIKDKDADKAVKVNDFENAPRLNQNDTAYDQVQEYCKQTYQKTIEELAMPSNPALLDKIDALEKRIARLEEYADAIDMVAELINDVFPE